MHTLVQFCVSGHRVAGQASSHGRSVIQGAVWGAAALLGSVSCSAGGWTGVRWAERKDKGDGGEG